MFTLLQCLREGPRYLAFRSLGSQLQLWAQMCLLISGILAQRAVGK